MNLSNTKNNKMITVDGEVLDFPNAWTMELKKELKEWRLNIARMIELPAYCVFPNSTLENLLKIMPRRKNELWLVGGFKDVLIDTYGLEVCELIDNFLKNKNVEEILYGKEAVDTKNSRVNVIINYLGLEGYFSKIEMCKTMDHKVE